MDKKELEKEYDKALKLVVGDKMFRNLIKDYTNINCNTCERKRKEIRNEIIDFLGLELE